MPLPFLLLIPVAMKAAAIVKTGVVVAKGAAIIGQSHAAQALAVSAFKYTAAHVGASAAVAGGVATAATVGAAATIFESGKATIEAAAEGDVAEVLRQGYKLFDNLSGLGGLSGFDADLGGLKDSLDSLRLATSDIPEALATVSEKVSEILEATQNDLPTHV